MSATSRLLIQVVAQLKPSKCGISDHAILLARELESQFGISTAFVVLNSSEPCDLPYPRIYCKSSQLLESCLSLAHGEPCAVLLHYSGYGFSSDGAPLFLPVELGRVRASGQFRVGVFFHELFASGMPWRSAFWYAGRQKRVVREIGKECDLIVTNLSRHFDWLTGEGIRGIASPLQRLAVFSNVGENEELPPMERRRPVMVVFGLPGTRRRAYSLLSAAGTLVKNLGIEEILDVGPQFDVPHAVNGVPVQRLGILEIPDLGELLKTSKFGFVPHPWFCLAKSGIFAAYCANGTVPVLAEPFPEGIDGLEDGVHLISPQTVKKVVAAGEAPCSAAAWRWYGNHRLHIHAETYVRQLVQPATRGEEVTLVTVKDAEI